jgi:hypothetical protein
MTSAKDAFLEPEFTNTAPQPVKDKIPAMPVNKQKHAQR